MCELQKGVVEKVVTTIESRRFPAQSNKAYFADSNHGNVLNRRAQFHGLVKVIEKAGATEEERKLFPERGGTITIWTDKAVELGPEKVLELLPRADPKGFENM